MSSKIDINKPTTTTTTKQPKQPNQPNQPTQPTNQEQPQPPKRVVEIDTPKLPSRSDGIRLHPGHCSPGQSSFALEIQDVVVKKSGFQRSPAGF